VIRIKRQRETRVPVVRHELHRGSGIFQVHLSVTGVFGLPRLLPVSDRDKDVEILFQPHPPALCWSPSLAGTGSAVRGR